MTRHLSTKLITLAVLAPCLAAPAVAQSMSPWYGGLSVGQTRSHLDEQSMADSALGGASTATGLVPDRRHTGYRVFGGRQLGAGLALEAAYFDLGNFSFSSGTTAGDTLQGKTKMQGASLDLVGTLPMGDRLALLGRIGGTYAKVRNTYTGTAPVANPSPSQREGNVKVGAGLQYAFGQNFMMRTEYERYRMNTGMGSRGNLDMISISAVFPFGGSNSRMSSLEERRARMAASEGRMQGTDNMQAGMGSGMGAGMKDGMSPDQMIANEAPGAGPAPEATTATTMAADAPQAVVVAPIADPVVAPVTAQPVEPAGAVPTAPLDAPMAATPQPTSLGTSASFGFDRSDLAASGKTELSTFARDIEGLQYQAIQVDGYADRLGSEAYNQALSQRRADTVKSFLVTNARLDPARIESRGRSEDAPVTRRGDCVGERQTPALVDCLQPDRRVQIGVTGTR